MSLENPHSQGAVTLQEIGWNSHQNQKLFVVVTATEASSLYAKVG